MSRVCSELALTVTDESHIGELALLLSHRWQHSESKLPLSLAQGVQWTQRWGWRVSVPVQVRVKELTLAVRKAAHVVLSTRELALPLTSCIA